MSRLEKLIDELCSEGVEFKTLGEIADISRGASPRPIHNFLTDSENGVNWIKIGDVLPQDKYINQTKERITAEGAEKSKKVRAGDFILSNSMSFGRPYILKIDGCIHDGWLSISDFSDFVTSDYLYHILLSSHVQGQMAQKASFGGAVRNLNSDKVKSIEIPVPPIEVQREIVRILDKFSACTTELIDLLKKELIARKKQYEYYREKLLTFGEDVPRIRLGEIGKICMCKRIMKNETNTTGGIPFYKIGTFGKEPDAYISEELYEEYRNKFSYPKKGDILISASGTIGRTVVFDGKPSYFQDSNIVWVDNDEKLIINRFLRHIYQITKWKTEGGTIKRLYNEILAKIEIPLPPLPEQKRIADILDRFESRYNDLSVSIPAEIAARQKQYEYYRDRLLTFREKIVEKG